jgi:hypothetical protein
MTRRTRRLTALLWLAPILCTLLAGPAAADWFDDYARGLDALKQGDGARAAELLERAARKKPEPGTNVLTYGTNRLDQYHPYLYLAEAYLRAGKPDAAKDALQRSEVRAKEPAGERVRLAAQVNAEIEKARAAAAPPIATATTAATVPPTPPPPAVPMVAATAAPAPSTPALPVVAAPRATTGTLDIQSDPPGASVLLGARLLGTTPIVVEVPAGAYDVTLRKEGAADQQFAVQVRAGARTSHSRALVLAAVPASGAAEAPTSALLIVTQPPGVAVFLDDEPLGASDPATGRLLKSGLKPGTYRVRLSRAGYDDLTEDVTVRGGEPASFRRTLNATPSAFSPAVLAGLFIAGLCAVALFLRARSRPAPIAETSVPAAAGSVTTTSRRTVVPAATLSSDATIDSPVFETRELTTPAKATKISGGTAQFGEYRLVEPLGKGGMASVYKAERRGEVCALKRPLTAFLEDPEFLERFLREAEIGRTLHHPNIIRIFERGDVEGVPYFTMELVEGETLQTYLRRTGAVEARPATRLVAQVAEALDYAHLKGIVHRDLKPSNIMILGDGTVKVMDYGIARARKFEGLTVTGAFLGTPDYVAPETAEGQASDARSDLYSLGIVFYEILTGRRPFAGDTPFATLKKHCTEPPPPPSSINAAIPKELELIVLRLLSKNPADRHPGAEELLIELRDFLNRAA